MRVLLALLFVIALPLTAGVATLTGEARAIDGDTIQFGKVSVRLQGIAAPEINETGGPAARRTLQRLIDGQIVVCDLDGTTANKRPVGICYVDGKDIASAVIEAGYARDCPHFSRGRYRDAEARAVSEGYNASKFYTLPRYCR